MLQQARERYGHHPGFDAVVTFCVLQGCRRLPGDVGVLAIRILEQMNNDLKTKPDYRKPAMYVAVETAI